MKVVFAGPSLAQRQHLLPADLEFRPPAVQGDVMRAVGDGATVIGLIDGQFEYVAPVWHKELLYALKAGVAVFGASSMGALRAAECQAFGMRGIGRIFEDYVSGRRVDDADVALLHGPGELGYAPLTVPIVNIDATLETACRTGDLDEREISYLHQAARQIHFKDRTWKALSEVTGISWPRLHDVIVRCFTDQKQRDALALVAVLDTAAATDRMQVATWTFNSTPLWRELYDKSVK
jgi:hypothetical protein